MATTAKKATAKKAPVKKAPAKKTQRKKVAPKKAPEFSLKDSAEQAVNVYLGIIGKGIDLVKENVESTRKESKKQLKVLEKRGIKFRAELEGRFDKVEMPSVEMPELDTVVEDVKTQINKVQDQVEEVVDSVKERLTPSKAA